MPQQGVVPDEGGHVGPDSLFAQCLRVVGIGPPWPVRCQQVRVHLSRSMWKRAEATAATNDRSDTLKKLVAVVRIPAELHVVVGVRVHETRRHNQPIGIQHLTGRSDAADLDDPIPLDTHVRLNRHRTSAIDHQPVPDSQIKHHGISRELALLYGSLATPLLGTCNRRRIHADSAVNPLGETRQSTTVSPPTAPRERPRPL